jgi:TRAP-type transport system periplasmic protein
MLKFKSFHKQIVSSLALGGLLMGLTATAAEALELRYSDLGPPRGPRAAALIWWGEELAKRTNNEISVKFFWSQSLVKGKETLKAVGAGLADSGTILGIYTPAELPLWNLANAPFGVSDEWVGMRTWHEMREAAPELRAETKKKKVRIIANFTTGSVDILSKEPITSVEDVKGKKFRTSGGWTTLMKNLGASTVKVGFGELYQALDRGTVDATQNYIQAVKAYKQYEVAGHITRISMGQVLGFGLGINLKTYNKLSDKNREILDQTSSEMMDRFAETYAKGVADAITAMTAGIDGKKVVFHEVKDVEKWKAASAGFVGNWIEKVGKKGVDGKAFIAKFEAIKAKYEKELAEKGYPWTRK